jgi:hypothetical protein
LFAEEIGLVLNSEVTGALLYLSDGAGVGRVGPLDLETWPCSSFSNHKRITAIGR